MDGPLTTSDRPAAAAHLRAAADRLASEAARTTGGTWTVGGLLATRPEVVARRADGATEHVAEARSGTARWITLVSPAVAGPLVGWLRATADATDHGVPAPPDALDLADAVLGR